MRRVIETDAAEIDRQVVFQRRITTWKMLCKILPLADGARDLVQQVETLQLSLESLLGVLTSARPQTLVPQRLEPVPAFCLNALVQFFVGAAEDSRLRRWAWATPLIASETASKRINRLGSTLARRKLVDDRKGKAYHSQQAGDRSWSVAAEPGYPKIAIK